MCTQCIIKNYNIKCTYVVYITKYTFNTVTIVTMYCIIFNSQTLNNRKSFIIIKIYFI